MDTKKTLLIPIEKAVAMLEQQVLEEEYEIKG
jgi:hypothetical protein